MFLNKSTEFTMTNFWNIFLLSGSIFVFSCGDPSNKGEQTDMEGDSATAIEVGEDIQTDNTMEDNLIASHMTNQLQIALGILATEQAQSGDVSRLGESLMESGKEIDANIRNLAEASGLEMAPALSPEYVYLLDTIKSYSGQQFDSAFMETVRQKNSENIERLKDLMAKTDNPITREEISSNIDILTRNQTQLEKIQSEREAD